MNDREDALRAADHCVKCGLCLPHCPTYRLYADEGDSPRGRIALAEGLLKGELTPDDTLRRHLDRCLLCRACEAHCPSGVAYSQILDTARHALGPPPPPPDLHRPLTRAGLALARHLPLPGVRARLARALPASQRAPAPGWYAPAGEDNGVETAAGRRSRSAENAADSARTENPRSRLGLLAGCVTGPLQGDALGAALHLLNRLGHEVLLAPASACCGALAAHQGDPDTASGQRDRLLEHFSGLDGALAVASGCALHLRETLAGIAVEDIVTRLARELPEAGMDFAPVEGPIALHTPCTLANGLRRADDLPRLLDCLPDTDWVHIGRPGGCCGAAGTHLLHQRGQAERLRQLLLDELLEMRPHILLTSNVGCALHLAEGAMRAGLKIEVLHPVTLLARQLRCG